MFSRWKRRSGFTLIEILLVMLITSILVLGVGAAFRQGHMLWSRAEEQRPVYQKSRLILETMREELSYIYMPTIGEEEPAGFSLSALGDGTVKLTFLTLNPAWRNTAISNLPARVSYEFKTDSDSGRSVLSRTEELFSGEKAVGLERKEIVLEGFSGVVIEASDPEIESLEDSWKSELQSRKRLPRAVRIVLKWARDEESDFEFETIVKIVCQGQLISS